MEKQKKPLWLIFLFAAITILFSCLTGIFSIFATCIFALLCIIAPSPFLAICPIISFTVTYFVTGGSLDFAASAISYVLPGTIMCLSYLKKQNKMQTVLNTSVATFVYTAFLAVYGIILQKGSVSPEIINSIVDEKFAQTIKMLNQMITEVPSALTQGGLNLDMIEQLFKTVKPFIPGIYACNAFAFSYLAVCLTNLILKKMKMIENIEYKLMPSWISAVIFIISFSGFFLTGGSPFANTVFGNIFIILIPVFFVVGFGAIHESLSRMFKRKSTSLILLIIFLMFANFIVYNLFYITGCFYCIMYSIKNRKVK